MILMSGFIREVRANFPKARITLIVSPLTFPLVELCPYVNEILTFDVKKIGRELPNVLEKLIPFCRENFWQKRFSYAFLTTWGSNNLVNLFLCWLSGARKRIGYGQYPYESWLGNNFSDYRNYKEQDNFLLTKNIVTPRTVIADIEKNFYVLESTGLKINELISEYQILEQSYYRRTDQ